jgi:hypothetical protein
MSARTVRCNGFNVIFLIVTGCLQEKTTWSDTREMPMEIADLVARTKAVADRGESHGRFLLRDFRLQAANSKDSGSAERGVWLR